MARAAPVVGALMVGLAASGAQAKSVGYEVDGQRYTYSTNNREQAAVARERIAAARAVADARAKADAERAANPLVQVFGSQAQRDVSAAETRLREVMASTAAPASRPAPAQPDVARAERKPAPARPVHVARRPVQDPADTGSLEKPSSRPAAKKDEARAVPAAPKVKAIVYDFASGIKTIHMADGSVDEDVFDGAMAASLKRSQRPGGPRISFVNEGAESPAPADGPTSDKR